MRRGRLEAVTPGSRPEQSGYSAEGKTKFLRDRREQREAVKRYHANPEGQEDGAAARWQASGARPPAVALLTSGLMGQGGRSCQPGPEGKKPRK